MHHTKQANQRAESKNCFLQTPVLAGQTVGLKAGEFFLSQGEGLPLAELETLN